MKNILMLLLVFAIFESSFAQGNDSWKIPSERRDSTGSKFTGNLIEDSKIALNSYNKNLTPVPITVEGKKSPLLAGLFSLLIPGSGEAYVQSYWKAAAFLAVEAAAIGASIYYNKKGDDATLDFQRYADANWSAVRYATWLNKYAPDLGKDVVANIKIDPDATKKPQDRVNFSEINAVERQLPTFSHVLPPYADQQYYELIGKYHQFNHGWKESDPNTAEYFNNLPQQMLDYAKMHILPDDTFYKYADRAVVVMVINHFLSAIDAAWTASRYNKNLAVNMQLKQINLTGLSEIYPQVNLTYSF
ncbi:MAG: hypothetical protein ACM3QX_10585 [Syntrophomonadaceae bacterium]